MPALFLNRWAGTAGGGRQVIFCLLRELCRTAMQIRIKNGRRCTCSFMLMHIIKKIFILTVNNIRIDSYGPARL